MTAHRTRRTYPNLKTFFRESGITQAEFAVQVNRSQSYISKVVNGHIEPYISDALVISAEASVPLESLIKPSRSLSVA